MGGRAMETAGRGKCGSPCTSASSPSPSLRREGSLSCRQAHRRLGINRCFPWLFVVLGWCVPLVLGVPEGGGQDGRLLLGLKQTQGNVSFQCSPSGPCLPCQYSEKNDEKYRCSETGYRIPLKCVEVKSGKKKTSRERSARRLFSENYVDATSLQQFYASLVHFKPRNLLVDSSESQVGQRSYVTYRSCLPAEAEEKLSIIGFEMIMVCLLFVSGSVVYVRQKRTIPFTGIGAVRIPTSSSRL